MRRAEYRCERLLSVDFSKSPVRHNGQRSLAAPYDQKEWISSQIIFSFNFLSQWAHRKHRRLVFYVLWFSSQKSYFFQWINQKKHIGTAIVSVKGVSKCLIEHASKDIHEITVFKDSCWLKPSLNNSSRHLRESLGSHINKKILIEIFGVFGLSAKLRW